MIRKLAILWAVVVLVFSGWLTWTFMPADLPQPAPYAGPMPAASPPAGTSIAVVSTGTINARAGLAFRGGDMAEGRDFTMAAVLVRHPRGNLLVDAGFGRNVDAHFATQPKLAQALSAIVKGRPAADQLAERGVEPASLAGVVLTHAHWDHVSGLDALPGVPVWINRAEREFVDSGNENGALLRAFPGVAYREYAFDGGPYLGFPASHDVWGDGSVVLVPAPGHTPGSTIVFVTVEDGARYALVGDLVWQLEGIERMAERPWLARALIGEDAEAVRAGIARMAALRAAFPDLVIVPAHDTRVLATLPKL